MPILTKTMCGKFGARALFLAGAIFAAGATAASAQNNGPQVGFVYPAGCRLGSTVKVIVGGRQLQSVERALISGTGVSARVVNVERPMSPEERMKLRDELAALRRPPGAPAPAAPPKPATPGAAPATTPTPAPVPAPAPAPVIAPKDIPARIVELERKLAEVPRQQAPPALAETVTLEISVAPDAPLGPRDLRLLGRNGLSLPLVFIVSDPPEAMFPAVSAIMPRPPAGSARAVDTALAEVLTVTPPVVVNGQILPGETDRIRFTGRQGQRMIVAVHARALIPYLADAVPGWFQAVVSLLDAKGEELAYADDFRYQPDPVLAFQLPADGTYTLVVRDSIYRGREDFVYRVAIGELPFVSGIFPLGGAPGKEMDFALNGWNLPAPVRHTKLPQETGIHMLDLGRCSAATGTVEVAADDLPDCVEAEPNDLPGQAQTVTPPVIVNGRIAQAGDKDWFRFAAKAGTPLVIEAVARRLRSPLDGLLQVCSPDGAVLASNDDNDDLADGLTTHHADPRLVFTPPADGTYLACLGDTQHRGGYDYNYRLRLSPLQPDFELRVVPSSITLRPGGGAKATVYALRHDGFSGPITLALRNAPKGFRLSQTTIPAGTDRMEITLNAPGTPPGETGTVTTLAMEGAATVGEASVRHLAVPADDRMQAFFYRHLVPAQQWQVTVRRWGK